LNVLYNHLVLSFLIAVKIHPKCTELNVLFQNFSAAKLPRPRYWRGAWALIPRPHSTIKPLAKPSIRGPTVEKVNTH